MTLSQREYSSETTSASESTATETSMATAKLIPSNKESLAKAGERIRCGHLVSFPTETVYGLGCHALDPIAVNKVFQAKERPLTDPLIVHVNEADSALKLWDASSSSSSPTAKNENDQNNNLNHKDIESRALRALTSQFWPGPLTIVARASPTVVPPIIMANTGYVACRSPSHPIARALIQCSAVPIAAPSANKFGHVSPTKASHVLDDLGMEDVWIVDPDLNHLDDLENDRTVNVTVNNGNGNGNGTGNTGVVCDVGVESTVAKVELSLSNRGAQVQAQGGAKVLPQGSITVLRHGAVSTQDIAKCLKKYGLDQYFQVQSKRQATDENDSSVNHVAPGQTIRHYSPNVQSYMVSPEKYNRCTRRYENSNSNENGDDDNDLHVASILSEEELSNVRSAVVIDFGGKLKFLQGHALAYRDLSSSKDSSVAAARVFDTLRWSETVDGAMRVYFPEIDAVEEQLDSNDDDNDNDDDALILAVKDRLTRAASGVVINTLI